MFIQDSRETLQDLWRQLYFSEEETYEFTPAWADIYTDASLEAHETEIARLESLLEERKPILTLIDAFTNLLTEEQQLQASTQDASRLLTRGGGKRDPTRLLREEKMRKRIAKRKPIVLGELKEGLDSWETHYGKPFLINGESFYTLYDAELSKAGLKRSTYAEPSARKPAQPAATVPATPSRAASRLGPATASRAGAMSTPRFGSTVPKQPATTGVKSRQLGLGPNASRTMSISSTTSHPPGMSHRSAHTPSHANTDRTFSISSTTSEMSPLRGRNLMSSGTSRSPTKGMRPLGATPLLKPPTTPTMNSSSAFRSRSELGHYPVFGEGSTASSRARLNQSPSRSPRKDADGFAMPSQASRTISRLGNHHSTASNLPSRSVSSLGSYRTGAAAPQRPRIEQSHFDSFQSTKIVDTRGIPPSSPSGHDTMGSKHGSENWQMMHGGSSSEDEFDDPAYIKWRQEAVKQLEKAPRSSSAKENYGGGDLEPVPTRSRTQRVSEFNWEKDTF